MDTPHLQTTLGDVLSYLTPIGYSDSSSCGYCRGSGRGHSYYARAASLTAEYYESLICRGWRRSGSLLYRPNQRDACCPHYTLRLDSAVFRPDRGHRQTINRFNRYIIGDDYTKAASKLHPKTREEARQRDQHFDFVERIHEGEAANLKQPPEPSHTLTVTLESDEFTEEKYQVFSNYQQAVHHEQPGEISEDGFRRFLCESPLKREQMSLPDGKERLLGSYHQCYRVDGKLVAVGFLDLLPQGVSSVYFIYDESIHKWSPGKLGALREIALALEGGYRWWYSGYYIHTCPKMKYKIDYSPQYVLDPDTYEWHALNRHILDQFDSHGYLRFPGSNEAGGEASSVDDTSSQRHDTSSMELYRSKMPGLPPLEDLVSFDIDTIPVHLKRGYILAGDLFNWQDESVLDTSSPKGKVAEFIAVIGFELTRHTCIKI